MPKSCLSLRSHVVAYISGGLEWEGHDVGIGSVVTNSRGILRCTRGSGMRGTVGIPLVTAEMGQLSNLEKHSNHSERSATSSIGMCSVGAPLEEEVSATVM